MTQLRDLLLQEAYPIPFAFLLNAQVKGKVTLDPTHTLPAAVAAGLEFASLPDKLLARKTEQSQTAAQLRTPTGFQCLTNEFIKQKCLPDMEKVKVNDAQKIK